MHNASRRSCHLRFKNGTPCARFLLPPTEGRPDSAFEFTNEEAKPRARWNKINNCAMSLREPKSIYLPGNGKLNLTRGLADFGEAFTLPREFLEELTRRDMRVAGLGAEDVAYLQSRLAVLLTRAAREDLAWPSAEDLKIKIEYLESQISAVEKQIQKLRADIGGVDGDRPNAIEESLSESQELLAEYQADKKRAEAAVATADDLSS